MSPSSLRLHKAVIIVLWDCKTSRSATVDDAVLKHLQRILLNSLKTWRFTRIMKWRVFTLVTLERVWTLLTGWTCSERSGWSLSLRWTRPELSLMRLCRFLQVSANYWHFMTHFCRKVQHTSRNRKTEGRPVCTLAADLRLTALSPGVSTLIDYRGGEVMQLSWQQQDWEVLQWWTVWTGLLLGWGGSDHVYRTQIKTSACSIW